MRYYRLPPEQWDRLVPLCARIGQTPPPPQVSSAYVGENDEGELVFAAFLLLTWHFENLIGIPGSGASLREVHKLMENDLLGSIPPGESVTYYSTVMDTPVALAAAERLGLIPMHGVIQHHKTVTRPGN